jgi:hypothetical protein
MLGASFGVLGYSIVNEVVAEMLQRENATFVKSELQNAIVATIQNTAKKN